MPSSALPKPERPAKRGTGRYVKAKREDNPKNRIWLMSHPRDVHLFGVTEPHQMDGWTIWPPNRDA